MADNAARYGFRWVRGREGGKPMPVIEERICATGASFDVNGGAQNVSLRKGDPVILLSDGSVDLCDGNEGAGGALNLYGIFMGCKQYWNGTKLLMAQEYLPSDISWGTVWERRTIVYVAPFLAGVWEIDTDDTSASYDTEAEFHAFVGENADYKLWGASGELFANPRLDISTHATTSTLVLRIVDVSKTVENADYAGNYVKMHVEANLSGRPAFTATGV